MMKTILLGLAGAVLGLVGWALCGLGLRELGILDRFDPAGVDPDAPAATTVSTAFEWGYPLWMLGGAVLLPWFVRWSLHHPGTTPPPAGGRPAAS